METTTMKAVRIHQYGGPEVLTMEEIARPEPSKDEVLIRNYATSVNPADWKLRAGLLQGQFEFPLPLIPGWDVAGTIVARGEEVHDFEVGDAVYGATSTGGTYAQYVLMKPDLLAKKPHSISWAEAAATPIVALTAWQALFDVAKLHAGQRILIHAAAGGVGSFAVQLAHSTGAHVIGTASARNREFVLQLGADEVIDYQKMPFEQVVQPVDIVLDALGGETQRRSFHVLKPGGLLVALLPAPDQELAEQYGVRVRTQWVQPNGTQLTQITQLIDAGKLKPAVGHLFPFDQVQQAQRLSETEHGQGKIVVQIVA